MLIAALLVGALALTGKATAQTAHFDQLANLPFVENRPTKPVGRESEAHPAFSIIF